MVSDDSWNKDKFIEDCQAVICTDLSIAKKELMLLGTRQRMLLISFDKYKAWLKETGQEDKLKKMDVMIPEFGDLESAMWSMIDKLSEAAHSIMMEALHE